MCLPRTPRLQLIFLGVLLVLVLPAAGQRVLQRWVGERPGDQVGSAVAGVGDVDLDGYPDVLVGAPGADGAFVDEGMATVYSGRDGTVVHLVAGTTAGERIGTRVAAAGDANRDGHADYVIGSATALALFDGATGAAIRVLPFADDVALAGDVDLDGYDDLVLGFRQAGVAGATGYAAVHSGRDGRELRRFLGAQPGDGFAIVAGGGDLNADGRDDIVVGAPGGGGFSAPYVAAFDVVSGLQIARWTSAEFGFGESVAVVRDVDLDGHDEVLIGAPGLGLPCVPGRARLFSGRTNLELLAVDGRVHPLCRMPIEALVGRRVAPAGDVDGDGTPDLAVASVQRLRVVSGRDGDNLLVAVPAGTGFDGPFAAAGDADCDGVQDFVYGRPGAAAAGAGSGEAVLVSGRAQAAALRIDAGLIDGGGWRGGQGTATTLALAREGAITQPNRAPQFELRDAATGVVTATQSVAFPGLLRARVVAAGDVDGDQLGDWLVGWHRATGPRLSVVEVYSGADASVLQSFPSPAGDRYGEAVAGGLDWNSDGMPDSCIGWPVGGHGGGLVEVRSGAGGAVLASWSAAEGRYEYGAALATIPDVDGDGVDELLVGAPGASRVELRAGGAERLLWSVVRRVGDLRFGAAVAAAGDVDGDGVSDVLVGAPGGAAVFVLSGVDGAQLARLLGVPGSRFGHAVAGGVDADGDGIPDVLIGAPDEVVDGALGAGAGYLRSVTDRGDLLRVEGVDPGDGVGAFVAFAGAAALVGSERGGFGFEGDAGFVQNGYVRRLDYGRGGVSSFGRGCVGTRGKPRLQVLGAPRRGGVLSVQIDRVAPASGGALLLSTNAQSFGASPLPVELGALGSPGCVLHVGLEAPVGLFSGPAATRISLGVGVPRIAALAGATLYAQYLHVDGVAAGGVAFSNAARISVGR